MNCRRLANSSGLLLVNAYILINPYSLIYALPRGLVRFLSTACPSHFSASAGDPSPPFLTPASSV